MGRTLSDLPLAVFLRGSAWAYPTLETVHLVAIALLFGSIVVVDLRILGLTRDLPAKRLAAHALPWTLAAFALAVVSGLLLFIAHAADLIGNRVFLVKVGLIMAAGGNAAMFHSGPWGSVARWDTGVSAPPGARVMAAASIILWVGVIACGRWIAYA
ncbi:MAG: hypothetical protein JNM79_01260 [Burkholderiales bacterium]|nr:hypothetical protein [Burkholderiales bacterium]